MTGKQYDMIVVGAGISGIAAARFYLEIHPACRLIVLEQDSCVGGTWNAQRSYSGFWTQWSAGMAEYSDMRMPSPPEEDAYFGFFKAKHTTRYLEDYVARHIYTGQSLREKIMLGFQVRKITKSHDRWYVVGTYEGDQLSFSSSKIIIASGLTSEPNIPTFRKGNTFGAPIVHQKGFAESNILSNPGIENVTVLGGGKSAADMTYACVKAGKSVSWVIRKSGTGPGYLFSPRGGGPYKNAFEVGSTRIASSLSPSPFNPDTWWTRSIHGTEYGRRIAGGVWNGAEKANVQLANFDTRPDAKPGFAQLRPFTP